LLQHPAAPESLLANSLFGSLNYFDHDAAMLFESIIDHGNRRNLFLAERQRVRIEAAKTGFVNAAAPRRKGGIELLRCSINGSVRCIGNFRFR